MPLLDETDLIENPTTRLPIIFCLDTSSSMRGEKTSELKKAFSQFCDVLKNDDDAQYSADVCVVTFDSSARVIQDFENAYHGNTPELNEPYGLTKLDEGVNLALDLLENRKLKYKERAIEYYQPWLVLMTDGKPEGHSHANLEKAVNRSIALEKDRKLTVFPFCVGEEGRVSQEALETIGRFSNKQNALRFDAAMLPSFFTWLSASAARVSASASTGTEPQINMSDFCFGSMQDYI